MIVIVWWEDLRCLTRRGEDAVAGGADHMVYCWDLRYLDQRPVLELEGHNGSVYSLALDDAHGTLFSGAADANIICWALSGLASPPSSPPPPCSSSPALFSPLVHQSIFPSFLRLVHQPPCSALHLPLVHPVTCVPSSASSSNPCLIPFVHPCLLPSFLTPCVTPFLYFINRPCFLRSLLPPPPLALPFRIFI